MSAPRRPHVVIIGGGFGGLNAAKALRHADVDVTLVDRRNFHLFQPLLYQVALGELSPGDIAAPLRYVLRHQPNTRVILGDAVDFDLAARQVILTDGELDFDYLVVAAGMRATHFGHDSWSERAPALKSVEDALEMRRRVLYAFEAAEKCSDEDARDAWRTFIIVGGGPTGVELAGSLAELARDTLPQDFRNVDTRRARILLVEGSPRILPALSEKLAREATRDLEDLGVEVRTGWIADEIEDGHVSLRRLGSGEDGEREGVASRTVLWAAGVEGEPLARTLARRAELSADKSGRLAVEPDLSLPGHPNVFVIGDLARFEHGLKEPLPGVAPVAIQEGKHVARVIEARLEGASAPPFHYRDRGTLATIGRARAVAAIFGLQLRGVVAWIIWALVHIAFLIGFENRVLVMVQWAWSYTTWNRSARLITGKSPLPAPPDTEEATGDEKPAEKGTKRKRRSKKKRSKKREVRSE